MRYQHLCYSDNTVFFTINIEVIYILVIQRDESRNHGNESDKIVGFLNIAVVLGFV